MFLQTEAGACDASGWIVSSNEGGCLTLSNRGLNTYQVANGCDEAVTLSAQDCAGNCTAVLQIDAGEASQLELPVSARNRQSASFGYALSGGDSTLRFEYQQSVCGEEGACSVGRARDPRYLGQGLALLVFGFWWKRARGRRASSPAAPRNIAAKSGGISSVARMPTKNPQ